MQLRKWSNSHYDRITRFVTDRPRAGRGFGARCHNGDGGALIRIHKNVWDSLVEHARSAYPEECCGVLAGTVEGGVMNVAAARRLRNASLASRRSHYALAPGELLEADRAARAQGLAILGVYHSHPDAPPRLSPEDLENAWSWYFYLVLSVMGGEFHSAAAWTTDQRQTTAVEETVLVVA